MNMPCLRLGIIACSSVARRRFLPALQATAAARLERVGSRNPDKAAELAREFSAQKSGSYEDVINDPDVDAIYVSTPPSHHAEWVRKAAARHKHILCEKPAFRNLLEARESVAVCRQNGVRLLEGYSFKYHPQHQSVSSRIAAGEIGTVRFFQSEFTYPRPSAGDIRLDSSLDGGVFHDAAGYPIAAALMHLGGEVQAVSCTQGFEAKTGVDDAFSCRLTFSGGAMANVLVAFDAQYRSRYAVTGTAGRVELERAYSVGNVMTTNLVLDGPSGEQRFNLPPADQFRLMLEDFASQVGPAAAHKDYEGELLRQAAVMEAALRSDREKRVVSLSEFDL